MHNIAVIMTALLFLCACTPNKNLSGISTASAVLLTVPLAPLAGAYAMGTNEGAQLNKQREYWQTKLDPVYLEKDAQIVSQDPLQDAERIFGQSQEVIFIPSRYGGGHYPGLTFSFDKEFAEQNQAKINNYSALAEIQTLLTKDPAHQADLTIPYLTEIYWCFAEHASFYKRTFNSRMFELGASRGLNPPRVVIKPFKGKSQCHPASS